MIATGPGSPTVVLTVATGVAGAQKVVTSVSSNALGYVVVGQAGSAGSALPIRLTVGAGKHGFEGTSEQHDWVIPPRSAPARQMSASHVPAQSSALLWPGHGFAWFDVPVVAVRFSAMGPTPPPD